MSAVVLALPGNEACAGALATHLGAVLGELAVRRFPDGESYVRIVTPVGGRGVILVCTLDRPDDKLVRLWLAATTARELGARAVGLVAPYLAYMRQDARFQPGEAIASVAIGRLVSSAVDWLVTVDPHLHRHAALAEVYAIPSAALHAAPLVAAWIAAHVADPLLIGPDRESAQWVTAVAAPRGVPCVVLTKTRRGDREVEIAVPDLDRWRGRTPVLLDDVVSTGETMLATIAHLRAAGMPPPVCVTVHAVFSDRADERLRAAGAAQVVSVNTIAHPTNAIAVDALLARGVAAVAARVGREGDPA